MLAAGMRLSRSFAHPAPPPPTKPMPLGGSPRANGPDDAMAASLPARAPSVRIATGGFRPSAEQALSHRVLRAIPADDLFATRCLLP